MQKVLALLPFLIFLSCSEQKSEKESLPDAEPGTTVQTEKFPNGRIQSEIAFLNGKKHGPAKSYYEKGGLHLEMNYRKGKVHGPYRWYYENGQLYKEQFYMDGKLDSVETVYHENGKIQSIAYWKDGSPGKGLKEFTASGEEKSLPGLKLESSGKGNIIRVTAMLDNRKSKADYFEGPLTDDKYLPADPVYLAYDGNTGYKLFQLPEDRNEKEMVHVIATFKTRLGNTVVLADSIRIKLR